jgi:hypothetical protein
MAKDKRKATSAADLLKLYYTSQEKPEEEPAVIPKPVVTPKKEKPEIPSDVIPKLEIPSQEKSRQELPPPEDSKSFVDSFGSLTQYLPSVADVTEYAGRAISPLGSAAYDLLPDHVQEVIKHGIQAGTGIDTGAITEESLTPSTLKAMRESAIEGIGKRGYANYPDYNIQNPSDALKSPEEFFKTFSDPKKRAGYIVGRTETFEIDERGHLILNDVYDFMTGKGVQKAWKPKGKEKFGWLEGFRAGPEDYENPPSSTTYSKFHNLFDKTGPYPWSGALDTKRPVRIDLGLAPKEIVEKLRKKKNPDPVADTLGSNTQ